MGFKRIIMVDNNRTILVYFNTQLWLKNSTFEKIQQLRSRSFHVPTTNEIRILRTGTEYTHGQNTIILKLQNKYMSEIWILKFGVHTPIP